MLDTLEDLTDAFNDGLAEHGFATHSTADYAYFIGDGAYTTIQRALPAENRRDETVKKCLATMQRSYAARFDNKTRPYQQVPQMLQKLRREGYAMAVLSNKGDEFTKKIVTRLLDETVFDVVQGLTSQAEKKPDPAMALQIAKKMKIEPEQFFYVGDTDTDMKTATAAGMYPAGALWGFRTAKELLAHGAKVLLETPMDIIEVLDKAKDTQ